MRTKGERGEKGKETKRKGKKREKEDWLLTACVADSVAGGITPPKRTFCDAAVGTSGATGGDDGGRKVELVLTICRRGGSELRKRGKEGKDKI